MHCLDSRTGIGVSGNARRILSLGKTPSAKSLHNKLSFNTLFAANYAMSAGKNDINLIKETI
jgi:hypothetical protein